MPAVTASSDDLHVAVAPSDCTVVSVEVEVGSEIVAGATLAIVEVMKIEQLVVSAIDGIVSSIGVAEGEVLAKGAEVARVEAAEVAAPAADEEKADSPTTEDKAPVPEVDDRAADTHNAETDDGDAAEAED